MTIEEKYNERYNQYCRGEITLAEWHEFCSLVLEIIMDENKDVLKNLKEKW